MIADHFNKKFLHSCLHFYNKYTIRDVFKKRTYSDVIYGNCQAYYKDFKRNILSEKIKNLKDVNKSEIIMLGILALLVIFFGFYPVPLMETLNVSVDNLINNYETAVQTNGLN